MQFTTSTDLNILHDEGLEEIRAMLENPKEGVERTLALAEGIAMELYQIEIIKPEEYQQLSRFFKRAGKNPKKIDLSDYPQFASAKSLRPRCVSEQEISQIQRVVPQEIRRDLTRCFRKEDIPFVYGLEGRTRTLEKLGLIDDEQVNLLYNAFNDKIQSFI